jgi:uncharacterized membrane protein
LRGTQVDAGTDGTAVALTSGMTNLAAADEAFLLLLIIFCLSACVMRVFWQLEQVRSRRDAQSRRRGTSNVG